MEDMTAAILLQCFWYKLQNKSRVKKVIVYKLDILNVNDEKSNTDGKILK